MKRLLEKLKTDFILMVSPPYNDFNFAQAAEDEGADGLKFHLNMVHPASLQRFGNWGEEKDTLIWIKEHVNIPVGIVPGEANLPDPEEMEEIARSGFAFWDLFLPYIPAHFLNLPDLGKMVAVQPEYSLAEIRPLKDLGIQMVEASIIPKKEYRQPLKLADLLHYRTIVKETQLPVLVSTQRKINPDELNILKELGVAGIVIGAVVTGKDLPGYQKVIGEFRKAIDQLK